MIMLTNRFNLVGEFIHLKFETEQKAWEALVDSYRFPDGRIQYTSEQLQRMGWHIKGDE